MAAACFALSACTITSIDTAIQTNLPKARQIVETAHVAFAATGKVKARTVAKFEAAYGSVAIICTNPSGVTAADALIRVVSAPVVISTALNETRAAERTPIIERLRP